MNQGDHVLGDGSSCTGGQLTMKSGCMGDAHPVLGPVHNLLRKRQCPEGQFSMYGATGQHVLGKRSPCIGDSSACIGRTIPHVQGNSSQCIGDSCTMGKSWVLVA